MKTRRGGSKTSSHQALGAAVVHPDHAEVLPLAPEPIRKEDGARKNDCARNAAKRLLNHLRREHPQMKAIIVEDAPASNGPHITFLKEKDFRFILGAKPGDHDLLFSRFEASNTKQAWERRDRKSGTVHRFAWDHGLPLNDANVDLKVTMLHDEETDTNGNRTRFSWVTDLPLDRGHGDARHARRPPQMGHRERDVPDTEGAGRIQVRARLRARQQPAGGRLRDARHARLPDRPGAAALLPGVPEGTRTPGAQPLPLEQASGTGQDIRLPGLDGPLPCNRGGSWARKTALP